MISTNTAVEPFFVPASAKEDPNVGTPWAMLMSAAVIFNSVNMRIAIQREQGLEPHQADIEVQREWSAKYQEALAEFRKVYRRCPANLSAAEICAGLK